MQYSERVFPVKLRIGYVMGVGGGGVTRTYNCTPKMAYLNRYGAEYDALNCVLNKCF